LARKRKVRSRTPSASAKNKKKRFSAFFRDNGDIYWTKSEPSLSKVQALIGAKLLRNFADGSRVKIFLPLNPSDFCPLAESFYKIFCAVFSIFKIYRVTFTCMRSFADFLLVVFIEEAKFV